MRVHAHHAGRRCMQLRASFQKVKATIAHDNRCRCFAAVFAMGSPYIFFVFIFFVHVSAAVSSSDEQRVNNRCENAFHRCQFHGSA